jgi:error-prone DNA polymerase
MGLRYVKGLGEEEGRRLALLARVQPFADLADFVRRARLGEKALVALAEAGAHECLGLSRRAALWHVRGGRGSRRDPLPLDAPEVLPAFAALGPSETIAWDYRSSYHSSRGHPLSPLRPLLRAQGLPDARTVQRLPDGSRVRYAGLVICRQQPGTANGVVFMTLEDETGFVNLVLWPDVFKRHALTARSELFLGATGRLQNEEGLVHIVVEELWSPQLAAPAPASVGSRDFC